MSGKSGNRKPGTGESNRRRRKLAAAKSERQSARRAEVEAERARRRRIGWGLAGLAATGLAAALILVPRLGSDDDAAASATPTPTPAASPTIDASEIGCTAAPTGPEKQQTFDAVPETVIDADTDYTLTLNTNCGDITIETEAAKAPTTVNAMLTLASKGFFDDTVCHRLTTSGIYVLQCGDPTGTGSGGPGFALPDENLPEAGAANYPAGTVAMANSGPGTAGSQFFIVYQDTQLGPDYTIWGKVTEGLNVVATVAEAGVAGGGGDGAPTVGIGIESTQVTPAIG